MAALVRDELQKLANSVSYFTLKLSGHRTNNNGKHNFHGFKFNCSDVSMDQLPLEKRAYRENAEFCSN